MIGVFDWGDRNREAFGAGRRVLLGGCAALLAFCALPIDTAQAQLALINQALIEAQSAGESAHFGAANRPSSPFTGGIVSVDADTCAAATWTREYAGMARTSGTLPIDAVYGGALLGVDAGCFNIQGKGINATVGVISGLSGGHASFSDQTPGDVDFINKYFGVYGTFSNGPLSADVEVRLGNSDYTITGASPFVADNSVVTAQFVSVSANASYAFTIMEDVSLIPGAGINVSRDDFSAVDFVDQVGPGVFVPGRFDADAVGNVVAYVGASISRTFVLSDGKSALIPFTGVYYYRDFGGQFSGTINGVPTAVAQDPGSEFLEINLGANFIKVLEGQIGDAKQLNASLRGDLQFGGGFVNATATGQLRLQF